jgi:hypothetical protein
MAAIIPARITCSVIEPVSTVLAIVLTICSLNIKKATKLKNAAQTTALKGVNTLVETIVAIEFAAS